MDALIQELTIRLRRVERQAASYLVAAENGREPKSAKRRYRTALTKVLTLIQAIEALRAVKPISVLGIPNGMVTVDRTSRRSAIMTQF